MLWLKNLNMVPSQLQRATNLITWCEFALKNPASSLFGCRTCFRFGAVVHFHCQGSSNGKGGKAAPKPFWAYRGQKQSEKAGNSSHPVGKVDQWGGRYVPGGYEIDGQFFPLPGVDWFGYLFTVPTILWLASV